MTKCEDVRDGLEPYIRGESAASEASAIADHLGGCEPCRDEYEAMRGLVSGLLELGGSYEPAARWTPPATPRDERAQRRLSRAWPAVAAAFAALAVAASTLLAVPALAEQVTVLPIATRIAALEADAAELAATVETLETRLALIGGDEVTVVETDPVLDAATNLAVQEQAMAFVRAMYAADVESMQALSTPALAEEIAARPHEYTRSGGVVFGQINNVSEAEGRYWVFVRVSDTVEFTDSQYQLNIGLERDAGGFRVAVVEMDA